MVQDGYRIDMDKYIKQVDKYRQMFDKDDTISKGK